MYSELIYTRCGEGIDILRGRTPIKNSGFKVFSCSDKVTEPGFADLPLLYATAQSKGPYADPHFMDDAYVFVSPDLGGRFLVNFHPIPFDRNATGDYSHRPGNFINQIFIGPFDDVYPYETFGNEAVWDAQKRGEAFYYENAPALLPQRDNIADSIGNICFDDVAQFVADGRRETLTKAIAFVVSQYSLPPEERKFLVIRDADSRRIELWIAAIESAFSPRMASGLSFATRLDKFVNANKYTVNLTGQYQTQINLQSPNQKLRYRAMLVGVDERDSANVSAARALANSPFVILDGKTKTLQVNVATTDPYYRYVTAYNEAHVYFCREFLQMVDVSSPSGDVLKLFSAYTSLSSYSSSSQLTELLAALNILKGYRLVKTPYLEKLYASIKGEMPRFLKEDAVSAFSVMSWLEGIAAVVGDATLKESFHTILCRSYADNVFVYPQNRTTSDLHHTVQKSAFAQSVAAHLVSPETVSAYENTVRTYTPADWVSFSKMFAECCKYGRGLLPESVRSILPNCIHALYLARDDQNAIYVATLFAAQDPRQTMELLLTEAGKSADQAYISYLVQMIVKVAPDTMFSGEELIKFYGMLQKYGLESKINIVLAYKARSLTHPQDKERFLDWLLAEKRFSAVDLSPIVMELDKTLAIADKASARLASKLQSARPQGTVCVNSAHLCALEALDDKTQTGNLLPLLNDMVSQGFPSLEDEAYGDQLARKLLGTRLPENVFAAVVTAASHSPFYSGKIASEAVKYVGSRQDLVVGGLLELAAKLNSQTLSDALVNAFADVKQFDKGMASIRATLQSRSALQYFASLERSARGLHEQRKGPSLFGRLFSRGSSGDPESEKRRKK